MPVDPSISLGVRGGSSGMMQAGGQPALPSPMETVNQLAGTIGKLNEIKLFNAKFNAQQKAGKILASTPDLQEGVKALFADPETAAFAPELANNAQSTYNGMLEASGKIGTQSHDAYNSFLSNLGPAIQDPKQFDTVANIALANASPMIRENTRKSIGLVKESLSGIEDPKERLKLATGWLIASGAGDQVGKLMTTYAPTQVGNKIVPMGVAPAQGGPQGEAPGQLSQAPGEAAVGMPAQVVGSEGRPFGGTGGGITPGGKNALTGTGGTAPASAGAAAPNKLVPEAPAKADEPSALAGDGTPLFPASYKVPKPRNWGNFANVPVGPEKVAIDNAAATWIKEGPDKLTNAQRTQALLHEFDSSLDEMKAAGPFTAPGAGARQRIALGKTANMISSLFGGDPVADPTAIASGESAIKVSQLMTYTTLNQMLGAQREAAETIKNAMNAVPDIDNSYLGGKLVSAVLNAGAKRMEDEQYFYQKWYKDHNGDLTEAGAAFNKAHPAEGYTKPVLESFGFGEKGEFKSLAAIEEQYKKGYLTAKQAAAAERKRKADTEQEKGK